MEAVILIVAVLFLLGIVLWLRHRVRSWIDARNHGTTRTESQSLNEAEALTRIDHIDPFI